MAKLTSIQLAYAKKYRDSHREIVLQRTRDWRNKSGEHIKQYAQEYNKKNKTRNLDRLKKYRQTEIGKRLHREEAIRYYYRHRERILEEIKTPHKLEVRRRAFQQWKTRNPDYILNRYRANREEISKRRREWFKLNPHKAKFYKHNRKDKEGNRLTTALVQRVYEDNIKKHGTLTCYLCNKIIAFGKDSLEHKIPLSRGGTNEYYNLDISHKSCNSRKYTKTLNEWREIYGEISI